MMTNLILQVGLILYGVQLHNLDQRQKVSKGEVLTLGGWWS